MGHLVFFAIILLLANTNADRDKERSIPFIAGTYSTSPLLAAGNWSEFSCENAIASKTRNAIWTLDTSPFFLYHRRRSLPYWAVLILPLPFLSTAISWVFSHISSDSKILSSLQRAREEEGETGKALTQKWNSSIFGPEMLESWQLGYHSPPPLAPINNDPSQRYAHAKTKRKKKHPHKDFFSSPPRTKTLLRNWTFLSQ